MELAPRTVTALVAACLMTLGACSSTPEPAAGPSDSTIEGVQTFGDLTREHTEDPVDYPQSPPVGGDHDPQWVDCTGTVYDEPVPNEKAVHALEHGAVWVTHDGSLSEVDITTLASQVEGQPYSFMSPYTDQTSPVVLSAWGVQLAVDGVDDERIGEFLTAYRQGPQTPEPGATCEAGEMSL